MCTAVHLMVLFVSELRMYQSKKRGSNSKMKAQVNNTIIILMMLLVINLTTKIENATPIHKSKVESCRPHPNVKNIWCEINMYVISSTCTPRYVVWSSRIVNKFTFRLTKVMIIVNIDICLLVAKMAPCTLLTLTLAQV